MDEETSEIVAAVVTTNNVADCEVLPDLLEQIDSCIEQVSGMVAMTPLVVTMRLPALVNQGMIRKSNNR